MDHWKRSLIPNGFEWTNDLTGSYVSLSVKNHRWTANVSALMASGERENARFFVEDAYYASLEKCLLFVWRSLSLTDKSTFDLQEAVDDLRRFAR